MGFFPDYIKALKSEWLKLKGSGMFWLTLIMSAFIPFIITLAGLLVSESSITTLNTENPWKELVISAFKGFGSFFYPLFLALVVVRLTQMEHRGGGWKLIETQPVFKSSLYIGKFSMGVIVAFLCIAALVLFSLSGGLIIMLAKPESLFSKNPVPVLFVLEISLRLLISGLGILGIQYFFSVAISGFLGPFAIGLAATIAGSIVNAIGVALWWPYSAPSLTVGNVEGSATGNFLLYYEWLSVCWMFLALWLGYQWYQRKTFIRAFFKPVARLVYWIVPSALFAVLFSYINKPVQLPSYNTTVIAGVLETKEPVSKILLLSDPYLDTVLIVPVKNNRFHFAADKNIPASEYYLVVGNLSPVKIFFGSGDSLYFNLKSDGKSVKFSVSGNRLAENEYIKNSSPVLDSKFNFLDNYGYEMKPTAFALETIRQWKKETGRVDKYKTDDNLKPAADFIALQKKLISLRYLKLLDSKYPQWFRVYHPNETLKFPESVNEIRKTVGYNDSSLLAYLQYRDIMTDYFQQTHKLKLSDDSAYIGKVCRVLAPGAVRDFLIFNRMKVAIGKTGDTVKRESLLSQYLPAITQTFIQQRLLAKHLLLKSLNRGKPAPYFQTFALNRDSIYLEDFRGRYLVIDVWATWCAPCKTESPYFEKLAEQYTSPDIAFVAISVDDNNWAWRLEANEKSPRVLQVIANDNSFFGSSFGIEYIPRFMLIGPDGKIINAQMPSPSEPEFENILKREVPGLASF